jgi:hypothetical protein
VKDPQKIHQICSVVYQLVATTQQQHPELLTEKWRGIAWQSAEHESALTKKLMTIFSKASNQTALIAEVEKVLRLFLIPPFFEATDFQNLLTQLRQLASFSLDDRSDQPEPQTTSLKGRQAEAEAIAILLLDAENLQPDVETERFLATICKHPLRVKIAFANWRKLGKQDIEFHNRNYDMFHVPEGSDMADGKMIAVGSSIREHYPAAREILVCSSDKVMSNLCTKLHQQGLVVYQVRKQDDKITVSNSETGEIRTYPNEPLPVPAIADCMVQLKALIKSEQEQTSSLWVKLSKVSQLFKEKNGCTISQVMSIHSPGKKARDFFIERPADFVVHQSSEQGELYLTLFEMPDAAAAKNAADIAPSGKVQAQTSMSQKSVDADQKAQAIVPFELVPIGTSVELARILVKIVKTLTAQAPGSYIDIAVLGGEFRKQCGQSITAVLKQLNVNQKYPTFLKSCKSLIVQPKEKGWQVAVRSNNR